MTEQNKSPKRAKSKSKKALRNRQRGPRGRAIDAGHAPGKGEKEALDPGCGPAGAMLRWARLNRRLSFVLSLPKTPPPKSLLTKLGGISKQGSIGLSWDALQELRDDTLKRKLSQQPYTLAEHPTFGIRRLPDLVSGPELRPAVAGSFLAAIIHGAPLCLISNEDLDSVRAMACVSMRLAAPIKGDGARKKYFQDILRSASYSAVDSYGMAEKSIQLVRDMAKERARPKVLAAALERQATRRREWAERSCERSFKGLVLAKPGDPVDLLILDILPAIVKRLDARKVQELARIFATPLGAMSLGLCPALFVSTAMDVDRKGD